MTVLSTKKPTNNNRDSATNQQQQQTPSTQQPQQQQQSSVLTRTRPSRDDEHSTLSQSPLNSTEDSDETNDSSSLSPTTTNNFQSMLTTTSSVFSNQSKRKSHSHHQHHVHSTINKQARRRCQTNDENLASSSNTTENEQYNSEDEYDQTSTSVKYDRNNLNELEICFVRALKEKRGFVIKSVQEDGACLFRAVSDQVFGDEEMHSTVRQNCMDYIVKNADFFRAYITEDFDQYITRKRRLNCHGNHIEMIALSEIYNRPIEVYEYTTEPINTVHGMYKTDNEPIRLSYHCGVHYNSIIDPWRPTAGHGLGLPDLEPGQAQKSLMNTALKESEASHIEKTMLDDKLAVTDWEATQSEIIQQIKRESYLQWLHETNSNNPTTLNINSIDPTSDRMLNINEASSSNNLLPLRLDERKDCEFSLPFHYECNGASTTADLDDDESLMRQVLAMSQIEYVESLKKQQSSDFDDPNIPSSSSLNSSHT